MNKKQEELIFGKWKVGEIIDFKNKNLKYTIHPTQKTNVKDYVSSDFTETNIKAEKSEYINGEEHLYCRCNQLHHCFMIPKSELINKGILKEEMNLIGTQFKYINSPTIYTIIEQTLSTITFTWKTGQDTRSINQFNEKLKEGIWVIIKEEVKDKQMSKQQFTVEGSIALKKALVEELKEVNIVESSIAFDNYLKPSTAKNKVTSNNYKQDIHYILPQQYNEAKQAFIDYYKEETPNITINGYKAVFNGNVVEFGCAKFHKNVLNDILGLYNSMIASEYTNRGIQSIILGKGLFTIEQIKEIVEYYKTK